MRRARARVIRALLALLALAPALAAPSVAVGGARVPATVVSVTDGDTVVVLIATPGRGLAARERVRLDGIDCPETAQLRWGDVTRERLIQLVDHGTIDLEIPLRSRDRYGRILAFLHRGDVLIQDTLVREGLCYAVVHPPTLDYAERLREAQAAARAEGRGIHDPRSPLLETPAHFRRGYFRRR